MEPFLLAILGGLGIMTVIVAVNCATVRTVGVGQVPGHLPFVSVLVPARDEERNLDACLASLARQDYPRYEVIVLDDWSRDGTWEIIQRWASCSPRIRGVRGAELPQGWVGKNFACHQLFMHAAGELLLFTDADTVHGPDSIRAAVSAMEESGADLLSLLPHLRLKSFWEKVVMPMLHFSILGFLPFPLVHRTGSPKLAMANGQFMLFRRSAYERIGGHEAVKDALVEDVWLARRIKQFGFRLRVLDGRYLIATRMYTSFREIWDGFSKNVFPGFSFSLPFIFGVTLFSVGTSVVPFLLLPYALLVQAPWLPLVAVQVGSLFVMRIMISLRFSLDLLPIVFHPVAMLTVVGIAANSVRWAHLADRIRWKGRRYGVRTEEGRMTISVMEE